MLVQNRTYEYTMREPARDQALQCLVDKPFRPVGFFVWGANQDTLIQSVTLGVTRVPWCSNRPAGLFQPALPLSIVGGLALLDTGYTLSGWQAPALSTLSEAYAPFPTVLPGTYMTVRFTGWAQSVLWWGVEPVHHRTRSDSPAPSLTLPSSSDDSDDITPTEDLDSIVRVDPHELPDEPPDSERGSEETTA